MAVVGVTGIFDGFELVTVTDAPEIAAPEESRTVALTVNGEAMVTAFTPVVVIVVPETCTVFVFVMEPEVAVIVIVRFALLVPGVIVALARPLESVMPLTTTRSPESAEIKTEAPLTTAFAVDRTRTVTVTGVFPSEASCCELTSKSTWPTSTGQEAPEQGGSVLIGVQPFNVSARTPMLRVNQSFFII